MLVALGVGALMGLSEPATGAAKEALRSLVMPYNVTDAMGNGWTVYGNGIVRQQQGNQPLFSEVAVLSVNVGNAPIIRGGQNQPATKFADKSVGGGEVVVEGVVYPGGVQVTRRIQIRTQDGTVRFIDSIRNTNTREQTLTVTYTTNINFGIQQGRIVNGEKNKDSVLGWSGMTNANRAVFTMWGMAGGKVMPRINYPEGSNILQVSYSLKIPAGEEVALVSYHGSADSVEKGAETIRAQKPGKLLAGVASEIQARLANAPGRARLAGGIEVLRGETTDVVETASGDVLRGTLGDASYAIQTLFGRLELPAEKVASLLTTGGVRGVEGGGGEGGGGARSRLLLVSREGEVFGGIAERDFLTVKLTSGQEVKVPLSQVSRAGYRKREGEGESDGPGRPMLVLQGGERMAIAPPSREIAFASSYGVLRFPAASVESVQLRVEGTPVHVLSLADGTRCAGVMLSEGPLTVALDGAAGRANLSVPLSSIARYQPSTRPSDDDPAESDRPALRCKGEDVFRGMLEGGFELDTAYEAIRIRGDQVREISVADGAEAGTEVRLQVTMWDGSVFTGRPRDATLAVRVGGGEGGVGGAAGGVAVAVPVDLVVSYSNPRPRPSDEVAARVRELVSKLNDDDYKVRESAQQELVETGPAIVAILREVKAAQPPEAQQRIEQVLTQLEKP